MELATAVIGIILAIAGMWYGGYKHGLIRELQNDINRLTYKTDTLKVKNESLEADKSDAWITLKNEADKKAEADVAYDLERAADTQDNLILANKDLHNVISELRNLFAKTQQQSASDTPRIEKVVLFINRAQEFIN